MHAHVMQEQVSKYTREQCLKLMNDAGITSAPVNSVPEALQDVQVQHRSMVQTLPHPTAGTVKVTGMLVLIEFLRDMID